MRDGQIVLFSLGGWGTQIYLYLSYVYLCIPYTYGCVYLVYVYIVYLLLLCMKFTDWRHPHEVQLLPAVRLRAESRCRKLRRCSAQSADGETVELGSICKVLWNHQSCWLLE